MPAHIPPEVYFVMSCARSTMREIDLARANSRLKAWLDWQVVFQYARQHGVLSLLNRHLKSFPGEYIPPEILDQFNNFAHQNYLHSLYLSAILCDAIRKFERNDLRTLAFKGPALAVAAYGDVALRQFGDLDILVFPEDAATARDSLIKQGFVPAADFDDVHWQKLLHSEYHLSFFHPEQRCLLELHWRVLPRYFGFAFKTNELWQRHLKVDVPGGTVRSLSNEDYLLVLCAHGAKHAWERLGWLCDVAEILQRHSTLDWDFLTDESRRLGGENYLRLGLVLANQILDAPVPPHLVNGYLQDSKLMKLVADVRTFLSYTGGRKPTAVEMLKFHLGIHKSFGNKLRYARDLLLIPSIADHKQNTGPAQFFTVLNRPLGLIQRHLRRKKTDAAGN